MAEYAEDWKWTDAFEDHYRDWSYDMAQWYSDLAVEKAPDKHGCLTMVSLRENGEPAVKVFVFPGQRCIVTLDPDPGAERLIAQINNLPKKPISEGTNTVH